LIGSGLILFGAKVLLRLNAVSRRLWQAILHGRDRICGSSLATFSIVFWIIIAVFLWFITLVFKEHLGVKNIEPFILMISIISTVFFSYFVIFIPANLRQLRASCFMWPFLVFLLLLNIILCVVLGHMFLNDALESYPSQAALMAAMNTWLFFGKGIMEFLHSYHALVVVSILTLIDTIIALFHVNSETRHRFRWLFGVIDVPTLIALLTIVVIRDEWQPIWQTILEGQNSTFFDGQRFEAGAITFQLLTANVQIATADIFNRPRPALPGPFGPPRDPRTGRFVPR
jgi:hypothetical protein